MSRICVKCKSKCLIIPLSCIFDGLTVLNSDLDLDKVKAALDVAQLTYLYPIMGKECFDELCAALDLADLPDSDENYTALPEYWEEFIDQATELLVVATEYVFASRVGFGLLKKSGFLVGDNFDKEVFSNLLQSRKSELLALQEILKDWLYENRDTYDCYKYVYASCDDDYDDDSFDNPFPDIMVI